MSISMTGGIIVNSESRTVIINGKTIPFHPKMTGSSISTINNKSYVDGFELVKGKWKRTFWATWHNKF